MKISKVTSVQAYEQVSPNFIYNRFDLFEEEQEFYCVKIHHGKNSKIVEYRILANKAELGIWLTPLDPGDLEHLVYHIAIEHPQVNTITYNNGVLPMGKAKEHNHFKIVFPQTAEEMLDRISTKSRTKMKKKILRAQADFGPLEILEYSREDLPLSVVEAFFQFKLATRGRVYNMTAEEYLRRYHVSHCYVLKFGDTIGAVRFSCEQCPVVYGENFAYNPEMQDYSLGRYVFVHHLVRMVEKKHTELFFAGGNFEYKTHYGSIEETLYDCVINRKDLNIEDYLRRQRFRSKVKRYAKAHLPANVWLFLSKVRYKLKF